MHLMHYVAQMSLFVGVGNLYSSNPSTQTSVGVLVGTSCCFLLKNHKSERKRNDAEGHQEISMPLVTKTVVNSTPNHS